MKTRRYVTGLFIIILFVPLSLMAWQWGMGDTNGERVNDTEGALLPAMETAGRYRVKTRLRLTNGDSTIVNSETYEVDYVPPNRIRLKILPDQSGSSGNGGEALPFLYVSDGERFLVKESGVLMMAGKHDTESRETITRYPGGNTYLVNQLSGLSPFKGDVERRSPGNETLLRTDAQFVTLDDRGRVSNARGPTRWHQRRHSAYYEVDYSETVTEVDESMDLRKRDIQVSQRVMRTARGKAGGQIPNHEFRTMDGQRMRLHQLEGPKLINVWATWCPPCRFEIPHLNEVSQHYGDRLHVVGVTREDRAPVASFLENNEVSYRVLRLTGSLPVPYRNYQSLPFTFLVDEDNTIKSVVVGPRDESQWTRLIEQLLFGGME